MKQHILMILLSLSFVLPGSALAEEGHDKKAAYPELRNGEVQYSTFPKPLETYPEVPGGALATIQARAAAEPFNVAASVIFLLAILHTFRAPPCRGVEEARASG
jgi:hypothetical protein